MISTSMRKETEIVSRLSTSISGEPLKSTSIKSTLYFALTSGRKNNSLLACIKALSCAWLRAANGQKRNLQHLCRLGLCLRRSCRPPIEIHDRTLSHELPPDARAIHVESISAGRSSRKKQRSQRRRHIRRHVRRASTGTTRANERGHHTVDIEGRDRHKYCALISRITVHTVRHSDNAPSSIAAFADH